MPRFIKPLYRTLDESSSRNAQTCGPMALFSYMKMPLTHDQCGEDDTAESFIGKHWNIHRTVQTFHRVILMFWTSKTIYKMDDEVFDWVQACVWIRHQPTAFSKMESTGYCRNGINLPAILATIFEYVYCV
ncbi:hypothetical protein TNCT_285401 [Trichonephila clavata]|uniref:Uncharacterized protein n=1 Tax=Trichonephila clavata TaxID=2740835 RepID=A0A8X6FUY6_TRICU|nr:hypothetical protein TNCT_285401 [Trichonephila clavata]